MPNLYLLLLLFRTIWAFPAPGSLGRVGLTPLSYVLTVLEGIDLMTNDLTSAINSWNGTMGDSGNIVFAEFTIGRYISDLQIMGSPGLLNSSSDSLCMIECKHGLFLVYQLRGRPCQGSREILYKVEPRQIKIDMIMRVDVNDTLSPDIVTSLITVSGRKSNLSDFGMDFDVVTELRSLWGQLDDLRWTMVNISTNDTKAAARGTFKDVDAAFNATIGIFS